MLLEYKIFVFILITLGYYSYDHTYGMDELDSNRISDNLNHGIKDLIIIFWIIKGIGNGQFILLVEEQIFKVVWPNRGLWPFPKSFCKLFMDSLCWMKRIKPHIFIGIFTQFIIWIFLCSSTCECSTISSFSTTSTLSFLKSYI